MLHHPLSLQSGPSAFHQSQCPHRSDIVLRVYEGALTAEEALALLDPVPAAKSQFTLVHEPAGNTLRFEWESAAGMVYNLRSVMDPASAEPLDWPIFDGHTDIEATPPANSLEIPRPPDDERYFVIEELLAPPTSIFLDDFESGQGSWTVGSEGEAGTEWQFGTPSNPTPDVEGPIGTNSGTNCFGTNLDPNYENDGNVWLRSPAIDLASAGAATVDYAQFINIEVAFDYGTVSVLDAADDSFLVEIESGIDGFSPQWEPVSHKLPAEALGKVIKIEFRLIVDNFTNLAGWNIDDFEVTVP